MKTMSVVINGKGLNAGYLSIVTQTMASELNRCTNCRIRFGGKRMFVCSFVARVT